MESWREKGLTEKQIIAIIDIEYYTADRFDGTTRGEAADYIKKYIHLLELAHTSNWAIERGYF